MNDTYKTSAVPARRTARGCRSPLGSRLVVPLALLLLAGGQSALHAQGAPGAPALTARHDVAAGAIRIHRAGEPEPFLTQHARIAVRPYIHPVVPADGRGAFTEHSPGHHPHQTGLYWGLTRVNGRDYFHHPEATHWRRVSAEVLEPEGLTVRWRTVYDLLDEGGAPVLRETQTWALRQADGRYLLDLVWEGEAQTDVTVGAYDYGGLFLRMPWQEGAEAAVVNAARQRDGAAEGQRAMYLDVGMAVEGRDDWAHVAIFDHPENAGFPQPWRVDGQFGVGPVRARLGDWAIPAGETETVRHRLVFYTGSLTDIELRALWEAYSGRDGQYAATELWRLAQEEGRTAAFQTPDEAAAAATLLDGFAVNAWAGEPMVTQPMAFAWDDRGRLWVAENRDYESRGTGFSNSGDSRIVILEDTDRDGAADTRTVFLEGLPFPAALAVGFDGVFVGAPPHLLFVPDRDGDDRADVDAIEIRLTGWGIRDRHETINSFHWGPDGWLYGLEGFATPSKIRAPGPDDRLYRPGDAFPDDLLDAEGVDINGGVWRYHPTKDRFEVVAHGFSNPWGIDYDAKGELFITACVIPHVFHVIPGGIYHRQGGQHFNPYVYNDIGTIVDHRHRSAHGGARVYQSDAFPAEHRGRLFMANIHEHAVLTDVLVRTRSGFTARHGDDFMRANNAQWIGFSVEVGPDGAVYVLDWHDGDICGKDVLDKDTGRVFRIAPAVSQAEDWPGRYDDLRTFSDRRLAELQTSPSDWHARRARVVLQHRATERAIGEDAHEYLRDLFDRHPNADWRLRALWALHVADLLTSERLQEALREPDEHVRAWAVQLLTEDGPPGADVRGRFVAMAREDPSPVVRKYLAAALQRMPDADRWPLVEALTGRGEDAGDHNIPKMVWFGFEPLVAADPGRALAVVRASELPLVTESVARRAVDADAFAPLVAALGTYEAARPALLRGLRAGLQGRSDVEAPPGWAEVYPQLQADPSAAPLALEIAQQFGDPGAAARLLATLSDGASPIDQRRRALAGLAQQQHQGLVAVLPRVLDEPALRLDAIRAIAAFDHEPLGAALLARYDALSRTEQRAALQTLAARPTYGWLLTDALKAGAIPKRDVPADVARQMRRVVGSGFVEVWGPIDQPTEEKELEYARYEALLTDAAIGAADAARGRRVFEQACGACHRMYGAGGTVGPDLTGSNRSDLDYVLSNVLSPSAVIQDDYKMVIVTMRDGRTHIGNVVSETERQLTLRVVGQDPVVLERAAIQSRETSERSLMPEGLFRTLTDQDVLDLMQYLRTEEQVPLTDE